MIFEERTFQLSDSNLSEISQYCADIYSKIIKANRQYAKEKISLEVEELLTLMQNTYGKDAQCTVICIKRLKSARFEFRVKGEESNPLCFESDDEGLAFSKQILGMYGVAPTYSYIKKMNMNVVSMNLIVKPVKNRMIINIFIALFLAIITRLVIGEFFNDSMTYLKEDIVAVIFSKMTIVITEVATFLVFFSVVTGITGVGSSTALGNMGKKLVLNSGKTYAFAALISSGICCLLYSISAVGSSGDNVVKQLLQLVLDMIPNNLVECFETDNDLQVIVLAVFLGAILLTMGKKVEPLNEAFNILSDVINKMMMVICKMLPAVVYFGILNLLLGDISEIAKVYKVAIVFVGTALIVIAFLWIRVKRVTGLNPLSLFKMQWSTTLINLSTSSQVAALTENVKCCKEKFGINSNFVDFALPLCLVAYMPCGVAFLGGTVFGLADLSGMEIDLTFIIKVAVMAVIIAIAAPPIPGSAFAVLPIMMAGVGVPGTFYPLAIVLGTVLGYFTPAFNGYCMQLEMLITANNLDMIDRTKLGIKKKA